MALVLLNLLADVLVEEQLAEDEGAHGLHVQALRLRQDLLIGSVDGSVLLPLLETEQESQTEDGGVEKSSGHLKML